MFEPEFNGSCDQVVWQTILFQIESKICGYNQPDENLGVFAAQLRRATKTP